MKHDLIRKIEDLDKEFDSSFSKFVSDTENRAKEYDNLLNANQSKSE